MQAIEPEITFEIAKSLGLAEDEFKRIEEVLGRTPNFTELSIFSVMWSEHCSYKNSTLWLRTLPRDGKKLLVRAGEENAGLVDIGGGLACAFKIESHNHPSAIEPFQGAATGVGGIHRDIFTMGARPIAALNSLRFGNLEFEHTKHLVKEVVKGIGSYGNTIGVPMVGGETYFDPSYNQNILMNAMSVGIAKIGETVSATAKGVGNPVILVGSKTGKDGIHGATFASADLTENSTDDLSSIQVGNPNLGKLLLEATLEIIKTGVVVGMQDLGAAGISCATSEMCAKGETGMTINLDKVHTQEIEMQPFEILISESQERMLIVAKKGEEAALFEIFEKWDLEYSEIGEVTDTGNVEFFASGEKVAEISAEMLVLGGGAPVYERETKKPKYLKEIQKYTIKRVKSPKDIVKAAKALFMSPNLISKRWIYEQYDSTVGNNSLNTNAPADAALIRLKESEKVLALTTDCNSAYVLADPYVGTMIAVAEAARNIVCSGGEPVAITNCLNFGNPYNPAVYWQFVNAVKGMGDACRKFETPVTGGNVSFYNQSIVGDKAIPVHPTPTIGMLGVLEDAECVMTMDFKERDDVIYMIGNAYNDLSSSEYLRTVQKIEHSPAPHFDLHEEYEIQQHIKKLIKKNLVESVHDVSEGGLFMCLMECAMVRGLGFNIETVETFRKDAFLFGESQSRVVVSISPDKEDNLLQYLITNNVSFSKLGEVFGNEAIIDGKNFGEIEDWKNYHSNALSDIMEEIID